MCTIAGLPQSGVGGVRVFVARVMCYGSVHHPEVSLHPPLDSLRLRVPSEHGGTLVLPDAGAMGASIERNRSLLCDSSCSVLDVPLVEVRRQARTAIAGGDNGPVVVTGHQPGFVHAGVWVKHVVTHRLAEAIGGRAISLVVDQDTPKRTTIDVPIVKEGQVAVRAVSYARWPAGVPFYSMPAAGPDECHAFVAEIRQALGERFENSMLPVFFDRYSQPVDAADCVDADWVGQVTAARQAVEHSLGVRVEDRRVSRVWFGPLLGQLIADARRFRHVHNEALADYRRRHRVRSLRMPMPDLYADPDRCEVSVWASKPGQPRRRLFVRRQGHALELLADDEPIGSVPLDHLKRWELVKSDLDRLAPWRLLPRALTLSLWARLILADLFVHGVSGAKYDRVTETIIREYSGVGPPEIACVSATLRLDLPVQSAVPGDATRIRWRLRDLRFNPQRYTGNEATALIEARAQAIARSQRLGIHEPHNRDARRRTFHDIRAFNDKIARTRADTRLELQGRLASVHAGLGTNEAAMRRDYFFAMHERSTLDMLLGELPGVQDFARRCIVPR